MCDYSEKILHYSADDNKELYWMHTKLTENFAEPFLQPPAEILQKQNKNQTNK